MYNSFEALLTNLFERTKESFSTKHKYIKHKNNVQLLIAKLNQANNIHNINRGGCAIVAHAAYTHYKQQYPNNSINIVYIVRKSDESAINNLSNGIPDACLHAMIKIGKRYYDSDSTFTSTHALKQKFKYSKIIKVDPQLCLESIAINKWNDQFDRSCGIPLIKDIFGINIDYPIETKSA